MEMSPTDIERLTILPVAQPLQDGSFKVLVTSLSGPDQLPLIISLTVTSVPPPDTTTQVSVVLLCSIMPGGLIFALGGADVSPHFSTFAAAGLPPPAAAPPLVGASVGPRWMIETDS